jgi:nucleotidyltransferase substrate binding protein (TIGR01987 family)
MTDLDIRWKQRLYNYSQALKRLREAVQLAQVRALTALEQQGLIQAFEFTHELAWNVMKDYLAYQGTPDIGGSRDACRAAFAQGLVVDGEGWMEMIKSRNQTSHTYNEETANEITEAILTRYCAQFSQFSTRFSRLQEAGS